MNMTYTVPTLSDESATNPQNGETSGDLGLKNPYTKLHDTAFWRTSIAEKHFSEYSPLWKPKSNILKTHRVVTFGSCFAQHIGKSMSSRGFNWHCTERPPCGLSNENARKYNYNIFSCRTANIYTTSLLNQWTRWALSKDEPPDECWELNGRFYDPFRPTIEPEGFASREEVLALRKVTIDAFREAICTADHFVFTLGLTESWRNRDKGYEYPVCPGVFEKHASREAFEFHNLDIFQTIEALRSAIELMRFANAKLSILLTVSPVPLVATRTEQHVLTATMEAKSVLRAAASQMVRYRSFVDYFPSYEIITAPFIQANFYKPNKREVTQFGVDFVMEHFFQSLQARFGMQANSASCSLAPANSKTRADLVCEEELLSAFSSPILSQ